MEEDLEMPVKCQFPLVKRWGATERLRTEPI